MSLKSAVHYGYEMATIVDLNQARKKLIDAIGENSKIYFANMKMWFRQKITKEDFDSEARKMFSPETVKLHNEFLLAVFSKCQFLTSAHVNKDSSGASHGLLKDKVKKGKPKKKPRPVRATFEHRFQPANPLLGVPQVVPKDPAEEERISFCSREATLPDLAMVHGRMFITAWDCGLDSVEDDAVRLVMNAVEHHLKTILMALISRRHSYHVREGRFQYAIGAPTPDPYRSSSWQTSDSRMASNATAISLQGDHVPSIKPNLDEAEAEAVFQVACSRSKDTSLPPASLQDLFEALQIHRSAIPSHSVYAVNMERMISRFWHPSHEEFFQDTVYQEEMEAKQNLQVHMISPLSSFAFVQ